MCAAKCYRHDWVDSVPAPTAASARSATAPPAFRLGDDPFRRDWLHLDDSEAPGRGLEGELGAFRSAIVQDVENLLFSVERQLEVDELQVELPFHQPLLPGPELLLQPCREGYRSRFILGRSQTDDFERNGFVGVLGTTPDKINDTPQFESAVRSNDDARPPPERQIASQSATDHFGNPAVTDESKTGEGSNHSGQPSRDRSQDSIETTWRAG